MFSRPTRLTIESMVHRTCTATVVSVVLALGAMGGCGGGGTSGDGSATTTTTRSSGKPSYAAARKAQRTLDGAMIDIWTAANTVASKPYACLRKAPRGGPELAKCVTTCQSCTVSMSKLETRLRKRYKAAPSYLRRYYHATYLAQVRNMRDHRSALRALAEYARVHGASYYQGSTEFNTAKRLIKIEDASAKVWQKRIARSRARYGGYLSTLT